tara:strand:- start:12921 stop:13646 length:726 start_codon:yes stop_codon:yes gene_type:complete
MKNKYIIRNNEHNSNIIMSLSYDDKNCLEVIKTSNDIQSKRSLQNELLGYSWYEDRGGLVSPRIIKDINQYFSISIPFSNGEVKNPIYGFTINKKYIVMIINHYKKIWRNNINNLKAPIHGDFSIGNVIINRSKIQVIDWEHFVMNSFPVGIDILNLVFEQLWFEKRIIGIRKKTLNDIFLILKNLYQEGYILCEDNAYLSYLVSIIEENKNHWGKQIKKMPILKFTPDEIKIIDQQFASF